MTPFHPYPRHRLPERPVILVHGYRDDASVFQTMAQFLRCRGRRPVPVTLRPSDGRAPLEVLAGQLARHVDRIAGPQGQVDLVAFSMGGLVSRYYLQRLGGLARVAHFVTLGTPHHGTWWAFGSRRPGVMQMRPGSAFLADLAADQERLAQTCFASIWTPLDLMIVPSRSSDMPVGQSVRLILPHHRALVTARTALATVLDALAA